MRRNTLAAFSYKKMRICRIVPDSQLGQRSNLQYCPILLGKCPKVDAGSFSDTYQISDVRCDCEERLGPAPTFAHEANGESIEFSNLLTRCEGDWELLAQVRTARKSEVSHLEMAWADRQLPLYCGGCEYIFDIPLVIPTPMLSWLFVLMCFQWAATCLRCRPPFNVLFT